MNWVTIENLYRVGIFLELAKDGALSGRLPARARFALHRFCVGPKVGPFGSHGFPRLDF